MKTVGTIVVVAVLALSIAYIGGVFDADVDVKVNKKVQENVKEFTHDTIEKAQEETDGAFETLKRKLK